MSLPQQPLHACLLPAASHHGSLHRATNPHEFNLDGVRFLGTSGQNVDDMAKYAKFPRAGRLDALERCLQWRHLAPTAPDTLTCYPFHDVDPFILAETPHVYFVGGQPSFETALVRGSGAQPQVRLVCVPDFASAGGCLVLLNLRTLQCHPMYFDSGAAAAGGGGGR